MSILVTGGAGYIGSVVAGELLRRGHKVVVYDNLSHGHRSAVPNGAEFVEADLGDRDRLDYVLRHYGCRAVMHFAAFIEAGESMRAPEKYFRNNAMHTLGLLESMLEQGIKRFVFSSTAALYGEPEQIPITEEHPPKPVNAYGESKLIVERILEWFSRVHGLRYASLRYFNAAGATDTAGESHSPETHLIPLVLEAAAGLRPAITIFGDDYPTDDGTCIRDYIHVQDLASAHLLSLAALESADKLTYNLGNGQGFSVREVISTARRVTGRPIAETLAERRSGDPAVLVASSEKIRRELNWKPQHPDLDDIIRSAWAWMTMRRSERKEQLHTAAALTGGD